MIVRFTLRCVLITTSLAFAMATFGKEHVHIKIHLAAPEHHKNQVIIHHDHHGDGASGIGDQHIDMTSPSDDGQGRHDFSDFSHGASGDFGGYGSAGGPSGGHLSGSHRGANTFTESHGSIVEGYAGSSGVHETAGHSSIISDSRHHDEDSGGSSSYSAGGGDLNRGSHGGGFSPSSGYAEYSGRGEAYNSGRSAFANDHRDFSIGGYGDQSSSGFSSSGYKGHLGDLGGNHDGSSGVSESLVTSGSGSFSGRYVSNSHGGQAPGGDLYANTPHHSSYTGSGSYSAVQHSIASYDGPSSYSIRGSSGGYYGSRSEGHGQ